MPRKNKYTPIATILVTVWFAASASAVLINQIDTFNSDTMGWSSTASPTQIATGGPTGTGDGFLQLTRTMAPEFHIGAKNSTQWTGNYLSEGITAIRVDLNHISGTDPLRVRLMIWGDGGVWGSTTVTPIATNAWNSYTFGITAADLTFVNLDTSGPPNSGGGTGNLNDTLQNLNIIQIRHDYNAAPTAPGNHPEHVHGVLGIDNIEAIPEPATMAFLLLAGGGLAIVRRLKTH